VQSYRITLQGRQEDKGFSFQKTGLRGIGAIVVSIAAFQKAGLPRNTSPFRMTQVHTMSAG
jgi:hypothetical protein